MDFPQAIQTCFKKYATASGRATRSEYWYWHLFTFLGGMVTTVLDVAILSTKLDDPEALSPINIIFSLLTFIPSIAVGIRRLHDTNRSGWWLLIAFTIIGLIPLIYWLCQKGTEGENRYDVIQSGESQGS